LLRIRPVLKALQFRRAIQRLAQRRSSVRLVLATVAAVTQNDNQQLMAGVAYYGMVSLLPFSVVVLQVLPLLLGEEGARTWFAAMSSGVLPSNVDVSTLWPSQPPAVAGATSLVALVGLLWGSYKLFSAVGLVVNRSWGIEPAQVGVFGKIREYLFLSAMALGLLISTVLTYVTVPDLTVYVLRAVELGGLANAVESQRWWPSLLAWVLSVIVFLLVYRYVPARTVHWRYAIVGAVSASIIFEAASYVFALFFSYLAPQRLFYGPLASVLIILIWLFFSALTLVSGAVLTAYAQSIYRGDGPWPRTGWFLGSGELQINLNEIE
jgi:membrane protein